MMIKGELAQLRATYEEKMRDLKAEKEELMQTLEQQTNVQRQLHLMMYALLNSTQKDFPLAVTQIRNCTTQTTVCDMRLRAARLYLYVLCIKVHHELADDASIEHAHAVTYNNTQYFAPCHAVQSWLDWSTR